MFTTKISVFLYEKIKPIPFILIAVLLGEFSFGQMNEAKFEELDSLQRLEKKPVVVFFYTTWCKYCDIMKNTTLQNPEVTKMLNDKFYFVPFDIEQKKDILFRGVKFKYKPTGFNTGLHELAIQLGTVNGIIAYPGICFLNTDYEITYQKEGFINADELLNMLRILNKLY